MEELKHEQEMRERRNQERDHWRDGRHNENSAVSVVLCLLLFNLLEKEIASSFDDLYILSSLFHQSIYFSLPVFI